MMEGICEAVLRLGLLARLVASKNPSVRALQGVLEKVWHTIKPFEIRDIGGQLFSFQFAHSDDRNKALHGGAWHYDNNLLIFEQTNLNKKPVAETMKEMEVWIQISFIPAEMKSRKMAEKVAPRFGRFLLFDEKHSDPWSDIMRIRVAKDITTTLRDDLNLCIRGEIRSFEVKYERMPMFCYKCGRIGHPKLYCPEKTEDFKDRYGPWLRASPHPSKPRINKVEQEKSEMIWKSIKEQYYRGEFKHLVTKGGSNIETTEVEHNDHVEETPDGMEVLTESREPGGEVDMRMFEKKAHEEEMEEQAREKTLVVILEKNVTFSIGSGDVGKINVERKGRLTRLSQARRNSTKESVEKVTPKSDWLRRSKWR
ncbi:unnamed protein product [Linum trigynum]|uniref:CCHC-type domain-containing protein n=1 Tax=Linum trigynum TaxID=586398 RepID=A0AAV2FRT7_9ROSI